MSRESRIKIKDLFAVARAIKLRTHRLDMEWLKVQRTCIRELHRIESESAANAKEMNKVLRKLERCGFSLAEVYARMGLKPKRKE